MTTGFARARRRGVHARFDVAEASLVASLAGQVIELLRDGVPDPQVSGAGEDPLDELVGMSGPVTRPEDPVLKRLLPDGYSEEPGSEDANADFRRFTERGLRDDKVANAEAVITSLRIAGAEAAADDDPVDVELDQAGAQAWLRCLTDLRLAIGTRLGVSEGDEAHWESLQDDDPAKAMHDVYDWLGFLQETLVRSLR